MLGPEKLGLKWGRIDWYPVTKRNVWERLKWNYESRG